eukprot:gene3816-5950_t
MAPVAPRPVNAEFITPDSSSQGSALESRESARRPSSAATIEEGDRDFSSMTIESKVAVLTEFFSNRLLLKRFRKENREGAAPEEVLACEREFATMSLDIVRHAQHGALDAPYWADACSDFSEKWIQVCHWISPRRMREFATVNIGAVWDKESEVPIFKEQPPVDLKWYKNPNGCTPVQPWLCPLCRVVCNSLAQYKTHAQGRTHKSLARAFQKQHPGKTVEPQPYNPTDGSPADTDPTYLSIYDAPAVPPTLGHPVRKPLQQPMQINPPTVVQAASHNVTPVTGAPSVAVQAPGMSVVQGLPVGWGNTSSGGAQSNAFNMNMNMNMQQMYNPNSMFDPMAQALLAQQLLQQQQMAALAETYQQAQQQVSALQLQLQALTTSGLPFMNMGLNMGMNLNMNMNQAAMMQFAQQKMQAGVPPSPSSSATTDSDSASAASTPGAQGKPVHAPLFIPQVLTPPKAQQKMMEEVQVEPAATEEEEVWEQDFLTKITSICSELNDDA